MLAPAANDNYRQPTSVERIERAVSLANGILIGAAFCSVLAYGYGGCSWASVSIDTPPAAAERFSINRISQWSSD
jgi:hypothetical protein